jgi:hypothetical protein
LPAELIEDIEDRTLVGRWSVKINSSACDWSPRERWIEIEHGFPEGHRRFRKYIYHEGLTLDSGKWECRNNIFTEFWTTNKTLAEYYRRMRKSIEEWTWFDKHDVVCPEWNLMVDNSYEYEIREILHRFQLITTPLQPQVH